MSADTAARIRQFLEENFLFRDDRAAVAEDESLLEAGLIDSTGILELVAFVESELKVTVADADIVPENFDSIRALADYVEQKRAVAVAA